MDLSGQAATASNSRAKMSSLVMQNMLPGLKVFPRSSIVPTSLTIKEILYKWNA